MMAGTLNGPLVVLHHYTKATLSIVLIFGLMEFDRLWILERKYCLLKVQCLTPKYVNRIKQNEAQKQRIVVYMDLTASQLLFAWAPIPMEKKY